MNKQVKINFFRFCSYCKKIFPIVMLSFILSADVLAVIIATPEDIIEIEEKIVKKFYNSYLDLSPEVKQHSVGNIKNLHPIFESTDFEYFGVLSQLITIRFFTAIKIGDYPDELKQKAKYALNAIREQKVNVHLICFNIYKEIISAAINKQQLSFLMGNLQHYISAGGYAGNHNKALCKSAMDPHYTWDTTCCNRERTIFDESGRPEKIVKSEDICQFFPYDDTAYIKSYYLSLDYYLKNLSEINDYNGILRALKFHTHIESHLGDRYTVQDDRIIPDTYELLGGEIAAQNLFDKLTRGHEAIIAEDGTKTVKLLDKYIVKYLPDRSFYDIAAKIEIYKWELDYNDMEYRSNINKYGCYRYLMSPNFNRAAFLEKNQYAYIFTTNSKLFYCDRETIKEVKVDDEKKAEFNKLLNSIKIEERYNKSKKLSPWQLDIIKSISAPTQRYKKDNLIRLSFLKALPSDGSFKELNNRWSDREEQVLRKLNYKYITPIKLEMAKIEKEVVEFVKEQAIQKHIVPELLKDVIATLVRAEFIENNLEKLRQYHNGEEFSRQEFNKIINGQTPIMGEDGAIQFSDPIEDIDTSSTAGDMDGMYPIANLDAEKQDIIMARREAITDESELEIEGVSDSGHILTFDNIIGALLYAKDFVQAFLPGAKGMCFKLPTGIPCSLENDDSKNSKKANSLKDPDKNVKISRKPGWKVGDDYNKPLPNGKDPSWNTVKNRYWKNKGANTSLEDAAKDCDNNMQQAAKNIERMKQGKPPQKYSKEKAKAYNGDGMESKELHHDPIPKRHGGKEIEDLWPKEHAAKDKFRYLGY